MGVAQDRGPRHDLGGRRQCGGGVRRHDGHHDRHRTQREERAAHPVVGPRPHQAGDRDGRQHERERDDEDSGPLAGDDADLPDAAEREHARQQAERPTPPRRGRPRSRTPPSRSTSSPSVRAGSAHGRLATAAQPTTADDRAPARGREDDDRRDQRRRHPARRAADRAQRQLDEDAAPAAWGRRAAAGRPAPPTAGGRTRPPSPTARWRAVRRPTGSRGRHVVAAATPQVEAPTTCCASRPMPRPATTNDARRIAFCSHSPGTTWVASDTSASIGTARGTLPSRPSHASFHGWWGTNTMSPRSTVPGCDERGPEHQHRDDQADDPGDPRAGGEPHEASGIPTTSPAMHTVARDPGSSRSNRTSDTRDLLGHHDPHVVGSQRRAEPGLVGAHGHRDLGGGVGEVGDPHDEPFVEPEPAYRGRRFDGGAQLHGPRPRVDGVPAARVRPPAHRRREEQVDGLQGAGLVDRPQPLRRLVEDGGLRQRGEDRAGGRLLLEQRQQDVDGDVLVEQRPGRDRAPGPRARWPSSPGRRGSGSAAPGSWCRRRRRRAPGPWRRPPTGGRAGSRQRDGRRSYGRAGRAQREGHAEDGGQDEVGGVARVVAEDAAEAGATGEHEGEVDGDVADDEGERPPGARAAAAQQHDHDEQHEQAADDAHPQRRHHRAAPERGRPRSAHHAGQRVLEDVGGGQREVLARRCRPGVDRRDPHVEPQVRRHADDEGQPQRPEPAERLGDPAPPVRLRRRDRDAGQQRRDQHRALVPGEPDRAGQHARTEVDPRPSRRPGAGGRGTGSRRAPSARAARAPSTRSTRASSPGSAAPTSAARGAARGPSCPAAGG